MRLRRAAKDRVHVFDLENEHGTPIYVHAKVCVQRLWAHPANRIAVDPDHRPAVDRRRETFWPAGP